MPLPCEALRGVPAELIALDILLKLHHMTGSQRAIISRSSVRTASMAVIITMGDSIGADADSRSHKAHRLGLQIVKHALRHHGGSSQVQRVQDSVRESRSAAW